MARVWEKSQHGGTELLMLLAISDFADDDGNAYPAVGTLAKKCRMKPRNAGYILKSLETSGELQIRKNEGPKGVNRYRVMLNALGAATSPPPPAVAPPTPPAAPPAPAIAKTKTSKVPGCKAEAVRDLYHQHLPEMPKVKLMGADRRKGIERFWAWVFTEPKSDGAPRAATADEALAWIAAYFRRTQANDFLMGRTGRTGDHANWKCDLDFLMTERGRKQVIEKTPETA